MTNEFLKMISDWCNDAMDRLAVERDNAEAKYKYVDAVMLQLERRVYRRIRRLTNEAIDSDYTIDAYFASIEETIELWEAYAKYSAKDGEDNMFRFIKMAELMTDLYRDIKLMYQDYKGEEE